MPILFLDYEFQNSFSSWQHRLYLPPNRVRQTQSFATTGNAAAKMVNPRPTGSVRDRMTVPTGMTDPYDIDGHSHRSKQKVTNSE